MAGPAELNKLRVIAVYSGVLTIKGVLFVALKVLEGPRPPIELQNLELKALKDDQTWEVKGTGRQTPHVEDVLHLSIPPAERFPEEGEILLLQHRFVDS